MEFANKVWRLLVAIKDGLVLAFVLLFFGLLYAALMARGPAGQVRQGALLVKLDGRVVEEPQEIAPLALLLNGPEVENEYRARDVARAIRAAAGDSRIKAVALDLTGFQGGGLVNLEEVGAAMDAVRAAKKPVLAYGYLMQGAGMLLAAHANEVWINPLGSVFLPGPGGYRLYYGKLLEKLKITAHIFRVGTYKDYVEPFFRNDMSEPSRMANRELYAAIWDDWKANVARARPQANIDRVTSDPVGWLKAAGGDGAVAAKAAGLADRIGTRADFGKRVASIVGDDRQDKRPGAFAHTLLGPWLRANPEGKAGKAIGVVTVAGDIVDGKAGPGTAGGDRIAALIDQAEAKNLAALVVRVDSPGGSVTGAEAIRAAIMRQKARGLPVVVSMANMAASGGYWVSTPGSRIFAEPGTVTGSIGIFAVIPSFEKALAEYGVTGDGVRTTPLSGQPDVLTGLTPEMEQMIQAEIDSGYARFLRLVANSRHKTTAQVDAIAQGRVWDGGTARQIGLVDQFGGLDDALAYAALAAHLKAGQWHPLFLGAERSALASLIERMREDDDSASPSSDDDGAMSAPRDWAGLVAAEQRALVGGALADAGHLLGTEGAQAYCLECSSALGAPAATGQGLGAGLPDGAMPGMAHGAMSLPLRLARVLGLI